MGRNSRTTRVLVTAGLAAALALAPGCSACRSVGNYYSSGRCYDDVGAILIFGAGFLFGVFSGSGHGHYHSGYHGYNSHCNW